jgi:phenylpropionate dioxygenase-like ring-hydroxylating dioxygenase large terminal subunit
MDAFAPAASLDLDREPLPLEAWYVACASAELGDEPIVRRIHDRPIVLFRDADGQAGALHDRCPHRGVALSLGQIADGAVACAYHGWRFDRAGTCVHIPSLCEGRAVAAGVAADAYRCVETDAYVWVWTGKGPPSPDGPLAIPAFAERAWVQAAIDLACEAMLPIENNLDVSHPYFTHPNTHPQWFVIERIGFRDNVYRLALTETGLRLTGGRDGFGGVSLAFDLPDRATVDLGPQGPLIVMHHTPTTPGHCR